MFNVLIISLPLTAVFTIFQLISARFFFNDRCLIFIRKAPFSVNTRITAKGFTGIHVYLLKSCHLI